MELREILDNAVKARRADSLKDSSQMTLGELIARLEPLVEKQEGIKERYKEETCVVFDFTSAIPTGFSSWRGNYSELAVNYSFNGYGDMKGYSKKEGFTSSFEPKPFTLTEFLEMAKSCLGKSFCGWKGGDFIMGKTTPLWVDNDGDCGSTGIVGVRDEEYEIVLETAVCRY